MVIILMIIIIITNIMIIIRMVLVSDHDHDQIPLATCGTSTWLAWLVSSLESPSGIDKSLALERKIESRKRNFSLDLENLIVSISISTLDFREFDTKCLVFLI